MRLPALRQIIFAFFLVFLTIGTSCNRHTGGTDSSNTAESRPEEQFKRVLESFRRKIEGQPIRFVVVDGTSRSTMVGSNKVSYELTKPAAATDRFKAVVIVTSESSYSFRQLKNALEESEKDQKAEGQTKSSLPETGDKKGVAILESDLAGKPGSDASPIALKHKSPDEESVTRQKDEEIRKYELIYENDRWTLLTKIDPKTESSIQFAFDEALARQ